MKLENASATLCVLIALNLFLGCATKRHVRESIAPLQGQMRKVQSQVSVLKEQIDQNRKHLGDLDRRLSTTAESAADTRARSTDAMDLASHAINTAEGTNATVRETQRALDNLNQSMDQAFHRLGDYRLVLSEKIYFDFSKSGLGTKERPKLARVIRRIRATKNYVIEIEGFADSAGDVQSNRKLSRKRADAVVHFLVVEHGVPLRSISELGAGADFPNADNQTPTARRENRRVDLKVYSLDLEEPRRSADGSSRR